MRGNVYGMAHPPVLPFSFLRAMGEAMKETPWMRITVTSSLNEMPLGQLGNRVVVRGGGGVTPVLRVKN